MNGCYLYIILSNYILIYLQASLQEFYVFYPSLILLFLFLLSIFNNDIILFMFFSMQLRASIAQFLLYSSITSFLLDFCYQKLDGKITSREAISLFDNPSKIFSCTNNIGIIEILYFCVNIVLTKQQVEPELTRAQKTRF